MPTGAPVRLVEGEDGLAEVEVEGTTLRAAWIGKGWLGDLRSLLAWSPAVLTSSSLDVCHLVPERQHGKLAWAGSMSRALRRSHSRELSCPARGATRRRPKRPQSGRHRWSALQKRCSSARGPPWQRSSAPQGSPPGRRPRPSPHSLTSDSCDPTPLEVGGPPRDCGPEGPPRLVRRSRNRGNSAASPSSRSPRRPAR